MPIYPKTLKFRLLLDPFLGFASNLLHEFVVSKTLVPEADRCNIAHVLVKNLPPLLLALNDFIEVGVDHGTQVRLGFVNRLWGQACHLNAEIHHFNMLLVEQRNFLLYEDFDRYQIRDEDQNNNSVQRHDKLSHKNLGKTIVANFYLLLQAVDNDRGLVLRSTALRWQQERVVGKLTELLSITLVVEISDQRLASSNVTVVGRKLSK